MTKITNRKRADWAREAIKAFASANGGAYDPVDDAQDLVTDIVHHLRLHCRKSFDEAAVIISHAVAMAAEETEEDSDD